MSSPAPVTGSPARLALPRWGFGAASFGNLFKTTDLDASCTAVDAAWDAGLRYFDTAPHYGLGLSEERLGAALAGRPREEVFVSTKVGRVLEVNPDHVNGELDEANAFLVPTTRRRRVDLSPSGIRASLDGSLARLGLDRVDVLFLHDPEEVGTPQECAVAMETLQELRAEGLVAAVGAGSKDAEVLRTIVEHGDVDLVMLAGRFTLLEQSAALPLLEVCSAQGTGVVAVGVFNSGLLALPRPRPGARYEYGAAGAELVVAATRLADLCEAHSVTLPHAAVQMPFQHPAVVDVTLGMRTARHVADSTAWMHDPVPQALWDELRSLGLLTTALES